MLEEEIILDFVSSILELVLTGSVVEDIVLESVEVIEVLGFVEVTESLESLIDDEILLEVVNQGKGIGVGVTSSFINSKV